MPKKTRPAAPAAKPKAAKRPAEPRKAAKAKIKAEPAGRPAARSKPAALMQDAVFKAAVLQLAAMEGDVLHVTLSDDGGGERQLELGPQLQLQLLKALLGPPIEKTGVSSRAVRLMTAQNFRLFQDHEGTTGLEILVGSKTALHVRLPGLLPDALETLIRKSRAVADVPAPQQTH